MQHIPNGHKNAPTEKNLGAVLMIVFMNSLQIEFNDIFSSDFESCLLNIICKRKYARFRIIYCH